MMRRLDREVKELENIVAIMEKCDVCRIALNNEGYPYILPLNFGMCVRGGKIELYFHGAMEGMKYDLIEIDNRASFEMDCEHRLVTEIERKSCTMEYESVIGQGHIEMLSEEEKYEALCILMKHYHQEDFPFNREVMPRTKVFKLVVEKVTGKRRMKKSKHKTCIAGDPEGSTNPDILQIAMKQSALDINCKPEDFLATENVVVRSEVGPLAKKYYKEPIACNFVSYGSNIVASVRDEYKELVKEYIGKFEFYHCFETPNMHWLDSRMSETGQKVCSMAEYFLPDMDKLERLPCGYDMKILEHKDFAKLYRPEWSNALCEDRKELDVLGIGAYDGDKLIGLAGCSADCDSMWQIGVDVLPEYRRQGIASALTSNLAVEILKRKRVPFYCCAWSNIRSAKNAIKSGFAPAWVEMSVKPKELVEKMNQ